MIRLKDLGALFYPRRASTQTWMMLSFAVFVGLTVVLVGVYAFVVLRQQAHDAARATLRDQARALAARYESAPDSVQLAAARTFSAMTSYRVAVAFGDGAVGEFADSLVVEDPVFFQRPEVREALETGLGYDRRPGRDGRDWLFAAFRRPGSETVLRLGEPAPPLFDVVDRMQATLGVGLALTLALTLLGAWIASLKVTRPLRTISQNAQRIVEGDIERKIHVRSRAAEIQDLTRSLNGMAERFRADINALQRAAQIQNEFIGNVSHEVKNPIFAVTGYLEALGQGGLTPEQRERYSTKGLQNLQRLNNLFSDLIEIAKLEYREDLIRHETFDLQELVADIAETVLPKAQAKGLTLTYDNAPLDVVADRARIRQVLTNLIENAVHYSDEGGVRARFRRRQDKVRVEVVDTGRGIPEEHLDRVFERFYRIDNARSRKQGGTGLGLSIVKQILQAHGEAIHVESTPGRGTRFWFELPLAGTAEADALAAHEAEIEAAG